jgi:hypothetical protein
VARCTQHDTEPARRVLSRHLLNHDFDETHLTAIRRADRKIGRPQSDYRGREWLAYAQPSPRRFAPRPPEGED